MKKEIISFKYIKEIIHINSLLKKNSKERIISLIKGDIKELKKKELKIIKKLSFFNGNKKLLNFILDFYDFHAQTNVIHKSKTIQLKIEDKLELPSDLKKEDSKKSWYIKRKNSGFEIIEEDNSEKD